MKTHPLNALILVDLQNDFFPGGALAVANAPQLVPKIHELLTTYKSLFSLVVATKDFHPKNHISFASRHGKQLGYVIMVKEGVFQVLWPDHCVQGLEGADLVDSLDISCIDKVFVKGTDKEIDSYSAFYDNQHVHSTGLNEYLKAHGVSHVYIAGLATDYCVKYSVLDAVKCGFHTSVLVDACQGVNLHTNDVQDALNEMLQAGATLMHVKDLNHN